MILYQTTIKVICLGFPIDHWCFSSIKKDLICYLCIPYTRDGFIYLYNLDQAYYGNLYINDSVYFKDLVVYKAELREERINKILE